MDVLLANMLKQLYFKLEVVFSKAQDNTQVQDLVVFFYVGMVLYKQTGRFLPLMKFELLIIVLFSWCHFSVFFSSLPFLFMMNVTVLCVLSKTMDRETVSI